MQDIDGENTLAACFRFAASAGRRNGLSTWEIRVLENELRRDTLFVALTRPQMFAGVTYTFFVINGIIAVELFLIFQAWWVLLIAVVIHGIGMLACLEDPRIFDLWITRVRNCPRVRNHSLWKCNSYRP